MAPSDTAAREVRIGTTGGSAGFGFGHSTSIHDACEGPACRELCEHLPNNSCRPRRPSGPIILIQTTIWLVWRVTCVHVLALTMGSVLRAGGRMCRGREKQHSGRLTVVQI